MPSNFGFTPHKEGRAWTVAAGSPDNDDTVRHQVNDAQVERGRQAREHFEDTSPVAPAIRSIDRSVEFLDLVTACHSFVAAAGRIVPGMRDRQLGDERRPREGDAGLDRDGGRHLQGRRRRRRRTGPHAAR